MIENHPREGTLRVNPESTTDVASRKDAFVLWVIDQLCLSLRRVFPARPRIWAGTVVTREDVIDSLGISPHTFVEWREAGLKTRRDLRTRQEILLADDLFRFIGSDVALPDPEPRRKKGA